MKLTIYKTKDFKGETFRTPNIECEYNIQELKISPQALKKLGKIISDDELNELLAKLALNQYLPVITQLKSILTSDNDEIYHFIRHVVVESGPDITCEQLLTVDISEIIELLVLMFRPYYETIIKALAAKSKFDNNIIKQQRKQ